MTRMRLMLSLVAVLVGIGCGGGQPEEASAMTDQPIVLAQATGGAAPASSGGVSGTVTFSGTAPDAKKVKMNADPVCQAAHSEAVYTEAVVVGADGGLQNVFIYVKEGVTGSHPAPTEPVVLDQNGCWYAPHVFGIQTGQPLEIRNSDPTLHNVNAKPSANRPFNLAQPVQGMKMKKKFTKPEIGVPFKCNVHPWMNAYAGVVEHPFYAVSDGDGGFTIAGLPDGDYVLEAWHEVYGTQTQPVTVSGGSASAEFTFQAQ